MSREEWLKNVDAGLKRTLVRYTEFLLEWDVIRRLERAIREAEERENPEETEDREVLSVINSWLATKKSAITKKERDQDRARDLTVKAIMETSVSAKGQEVSEKYLEDLFNTMRNSWLDSFPLEGRAANAHDDICKDIYEEKDILIRAVKMLAFLDVLSA